MASMQWCPSLLLLLCACAVADIVLHNPRGSNNRLNEATSNRASNNRLFNTQNNNRGGYNVGDATDEAFEDEDGQFNMEYFQSDADGGKTYLEVEWTNQHGCGAIDGDGGGAQKRYCDVVMQYMCQDDTDELEQDTIRNGADTSRQSFTIGSAEAAKSNSNKDSNVDLTLGLHETWDWYKACYLREANGGLFLADQELDVNNFDYSSAIHTRQNSDGDRSGYECEEERDYWPYWQPTPWTDIAVLTSDTSRCETYQATSSNTEQKGKCFEETTRQQVVYDLPSMYIDQDQCEEAGGTWLMQSTYLEKAPEITSEEECTGTIEGTELTYFWAIPMDAEYGSRVEECLVLPPPVVCQEAEFSRMNHQGNTKDGQMLRYKWELPYFPSGDTKRCAFRIRYNISTFDYAPLDTFADQNGDASPITNNPAVDVITDDDSDASLSLQLAINTAQFGRTFQDRSHVFKLMPREADSDMAGRDIYNLNVRGRRGNIVQTFPSVEYDFTPNDLELSSEDLVHIQWTGSNTNVEGDAGQGTDGTDRNNLVPVDEPELNVPVTADGLVNSGWESASVVWTYFGNTDITAGDLYVNLASSGYYRCLNADNCPDDDDADYLLSTKDQMDGELNDAPASYAGVVLKFTDAGDYYFMCTRNNAFTNRAQKGGFTVYEADMKRSLAIRKVKKVKQQKKAALEAELKAVKQAKKAALEAELEKKAVKQAKKSLLEAELEEAVKRLLKKLE